MIAAIEQVARPIPSRRFQRGSARGGGGKHTSTGVPGTDAQRAAGLAGLGDVTPAVGGESPQYDCRERTPLCVHRRFLQEQTRNGIRGFARLSSEGMRVKL